MPTFEEVVHIYLTEIRDQRNKLGTTAELSYRDYLGKFLRGAAEALGFVADFTGEATTTHTFGRPDYVVTNGLKQIGCVEAEALTADLSNLKGHAKKQNERFMQDLHNFLLTNHLDFRLFLDGREVASARLPDPPEHGRVVVLEAALGSLRELLARFLSESIPAAVSAEAIAQQLAKRARALRVAADAMLSHNDSPLHSFWNAYKETLYSNLSAEKFADVYAQTFTYGLFLAWLNHDKGVFDRRAALDDIPDSVPAVQVLLEFGGGRRLPKEFEWIVDGICSDLAAADREGALRPFADGRDPIMHFYETFLAAYDPALREQRGVYYTPDAVVDFMVRALDDILVREFGKAEGLADKTVTLLDPAVGTATFLARAYRKVKETLEERGEAGYWPTRAREHLAQNFYGFELLPAAYTLAHVKLRQLLHELGAPLPDDVRLPIYLTNTLDNRVPEQQNLPMMDVFTREVRAAAEVKEKKKILVILGNPPYSGHSANPSKGLKGELTFIGEKMRDYYVVDGQPLGEKNPKWLQDDYVKFLRFAQWMIEKNGEGVVAFITNHGYLDNPTFRGMRRSLMTTFDKIYVYDLHGNSNKKERAPDGTKDENVFDIQQGVAICFLVKLPLEGSS